MDVRQLEFTSYPSRLAIAAAARPVARSGTSSKGEGAATHARPRLRIRRRHSRKSDCQQRGNVKTESAVNLFLESRRSKRLSRVTIDTYRWALGKMGRIYPGELPQTSAEIQRVFIANSGLSSSSHSDDMGEAAHLLVLGRGRGHLRQCDEGRSRSRNEAQAAPHTPV